MLMTTINNDDDSDDETTTTSTTTTDHLILARWPVLAIVNKKREPDEEWILSYWWTPDWK